MPNSTQRRARGADSEDPDEYRAASIFWVPKEARWAHLKASAPQPTIGTINVTIDWTVCQNVRAQLRVIVKRILRKHGYPPDKQEKATQTVLEQAEVLSELWATA